MNLVPLFLLWAFGQRSSPGPIVAPFMWPTTASPPPPMPAFTPQPTPTSADTGTPLASLAQPAPDHPAASVSPARKRDSKKTKAKSAASRALSLARGKISLPGLSSQPSSKSVSVLEIQKLLINRGAGLKPDGLYGPKTAAAWQAAAKSKGLSPSIARVGPKVAKVIAKTYDALKVPPIP